MILIYPLVRNADPAAHKRFFFPIPTTRTSDGSRLSVLPCMNKTNGNICVQFKVDVHVCAHNSLVSITAVAIQAPCLF